MSEQYSDILQSIQVGKDHIELTFKVTLQADSIESSAFLLATDEATPTEIGFQPVDLMEYYNSISRVLRIFYLSIPPEGEYLFTLSGLKNANGATLPSETITVNYPYSEEAEVYEPSDPITIYDNSIRRQAFVATETIRASNPYFYVVDTDPENDSVFVEHDHNRGRISVTFSDRPSPQFLTSQFIKVQKKNMRKVGRWETLPISMSLDSYYPTLYIYIPAVDEDATPSATPVYGVDGLSYYEDNYKYRVIISKQVGANI